eukprot:CAMPEP_0175314522 /NCGR_PEP_ID=MMETSP0093-20121207/68437_1 /TAXON_ID=311494 /ORGANISM="Alexandrium monilatum, Strain CCMP3105" /LENGTH=54 /DNA_ID=CAMNT_0016611251 /DNA_START=24 /DNA_END=185 /DNA_ORIENTATION=+
MANEVRRLGDGAPAARLPAASAATPGRAPGLSACRFSMKSRARSRCTTVARGPI